MFFAIHFFTDFIDLSPKKTMQFIRENPFRKVKKDFKTFVFDVGITLNREKYQSQMLPTAWFCPLFFIWVASGNNESSLSREEFLGNEKTLRPAKWLTEEKNRGVHWLVITLLPSDKTEMYKIQALP